MGEAIDNVISFYYNLKWRWVCYWNIKKNARRCFFKNI